MQDMNPIEFFKWVYLGHNLGYIGMIMFRSMLVIMLWLTFRRSLIDKGCGSVDRKWSRICGTILTRMERLYPEYEKTMLVYAKFTQKSMRLKPLLELVREIPKEVKLQAERDYCLQDSKNTITVTSLRMQFAFLLTQIKNSNTQNTNNEK